MIAFYPYAPPSFLTMLGSLAAVKLLRKKGFPDNLYNWRFVTLTMDRRRYESPEQAYDIGVRHLREFVYRLRKKYAITRWAWKMELHEPEPLTGEQWAHWHLLMDYKRPIDKDEVEALWGKGRTEIKGIRDKGFDYVFKYFSKTVADLPEWLLKKKRIRIFQSSKAFFPASGAVRKKKDGPSPRPGEHAADTDTQNEWREVAPGVFARESEDKLPRNEVATIGERLMRWARSVVSRSVDAETGMGRYQVHLMMGETWHDLLVSAARDKFLHGLTGADIKITKNKIHVSCLQILPRNLLVYHPARS